LPPMSTSLLNELRVFFIILLDLLKLKKSKKPQWTPAMFSSF